MSRNFILAIALVISVAVRAQDIEINGKIWQSNNLSTNKYSNGDLINEAKDMEDWLIYAKRGQGCYIKHNDQYYYNYYAIYDGRDLAPDGYRIATDNDWLSINLFLRQYDYRDNGKILKSKQGWATYSITVDGGRSRPEIVDGNGTNQLGFNAMPCGYYSNKGKFVADNGFKAYWASKSQIDILYFVSLGSEPQKNERLYKDFLSEPSYFIIGERVRDDGFCVRCVKSN